MKKKTYIIPEIHCCDLQAEAMLATSKHNGSVGLDDLIEGENDWFTSTHKGNISSEYDYWQE